MSLGSVCIASAPAFRSFSRTFSKSCITSRYSFPIVESEVCRTRDQWTGTVFSGFPWTVYQLPHRVMNLVCKVTVNLSSDLKVMCGDLSERTVAWQQETCSLGSQTTSNPLRTASCSKSSWVCLCHSPHAIFHFSCGHSSNSLNV